MGLLGSLLSFIPGVGPALGAAADTIGAGASGAAKSRAAGRQAEANTLLQQDQNILNRAGILNRGETDRAGIDLDRRTFTENVGRERMGQAGMADRMQNFNQAHDAFNAGPRTQQIIGMGGRRSTLPRFGPSQGALNRVSDESDELAGLIRERALGAQRAGDQFDPVTMTDPQITGVAGSGRTLPRAGLFDKILGGVAGVAGLPGDFGKRDKLPQSGVQRGTGGGILGSNTSLFGGR